jgi:hypothetical protein
VPPRIDLTFDCADPPALAAFWKLALGYEDEPPPPPFATRAEWLAHHGVPDDEAGDAAYIHDPTGRGPRIALLRVPEGKAAKNRLHLDLRVSAGVPPDEAWPTITAEVTRLAQAGATPFATYAPHHVSLHDPEGNEFCIC